MRDLKRKFTFAGMTALSVVVLLQIMVVPSPAQSDAAQPNDAVLVAKAKAIHSRVLKLDTHNDIEPSNFTPD